MSVRVLYCICSAYRYLERSQWFSNLATSDW